MGRVDGKVALITGAARGQGRAHALRLAREGARIVAVDVCGPVLRDVTYPPSSPEDLAETARLVEAQGAGVIARQADVRDQPALDSVVAEALERFGRLDVVVANAGVASYELGWKIPEDWWQDTIDVNLTGVWRTLKAAIGPMIEAGNGGSLVVISSTVGLKGMPFLAHYSATKHAVVGLARSLALELGQYAIRVNTIHPGAIDTDMGRDPRVGQLIDEHPDLGAFYRGPKTLPVGWLAPSDVSDAVLWLASDESRHVTGVCLPVDAGSSIR